jgi:hypothetical protein
MIADSLLEQLVCNTLRYLQELLCSESEATVV